MSKICSEIVNDWLDLVAQISSEMPERRTEEMLLIASILLMAREIKYNREDT